jgi:hypothetical protein
MRGRTIKLRLVRKQTIEESLRRLLQSFERDEFKRWFSKLANWTYRITTQLISKEKGCVVSIQETAEKS